MCDHTYFLNILLVLLSFCQQLDACIPSFDDLPPPVVHTECLQPETACARGYYCGPYGCARTRSRLHGVRNYNTKKQEMLAKLGSSSPSISYRSVNDAMFQCCLDHQLPDSCLEKCGFDKYNKKAIIEIALRQSECPLITLPVIHGCASRKQDHTVCCQRSGVSEDCLQFCQPHPSRRRVVQQQLHCLDEIELMKACFFTDMAREIREEVEREKNDVYFIKTI